ncbi:NADH dehydrogenase [ubiquinone] 1 beta subcomplex subunit 2, mitochondrial [Gryllus bimaculatus]|nr:NADH dehydrogenase [ubiquinone] 1 beta subcomplex subunit 2, mitochondrial [Gryllus bimaculatus]
MIISRGSNLLRTVLMKRGLTSPAISRNSHNWVYRVAAETPPKSSFLVAEIVGGFMWWWILWHLWHEPEHITGEFPYPDPSKWTDEELGIPEDDDELGLINSE